MPRIAPEPVGNLGKSWRNNLRRLFVLLLLGLPLYYLFTLIYFRYFWRGDWGRAIAEIIYSALRR
jgi:hypothetical protein